PDHHDRAHAGDDALMPGNVADAERLPCPGFGQKADRQKREDQRTVDKVEDDQGAQRSPGHGQDGGMFHLGDSEMCLSINNMHLIDYRQALFFFTSGWGPYGGRKLSAEGAEVPLRQRLRGECAVDAEDSCALPPSLLRRFGGLTLSPAEALA